jgi:hypothetical protein
MRNAVSYSLPYKYIFYLEFFELRKGYFEPLQFKSV